jgi:serine/threonine protein kinase
MAEALYYLHEEKRLVHHDLKPENLLLGDDGKVLLTDIGLKTILQSTHSLDTEVMAGTFAYVAPEQIEGKPQPASDQYALGMIVYEWLTGECPFQGSVKAIIRQHQLIPPPSLLAKVPTLPPLVDQVVQTALAKDPTERFATVRAFANAFEQASRS